jgi:hypothetical protein
MLEAKAQVQDYFLAFLDRTGAEFTEANEFLMAFHESPDCFPILLDILFTTANERLRRSAIVSIGIFVRRFFTSLPDSSAVYANLLDLMVFAASSYVRTYVRFWVQTALAESLVPLAQSRLEQWSASGTARGIEAALYVATMCILYIGAAVLDLSAPLVNAARSIDDPAARLAGVLHSLNLIALLEEGDGRAATFIEAAIRMLGESFAAGRDDDLQALVRQLVYTVDACLTPDVGLQVLDAALELVGDESAPLARRRLVQELSDTCVINWSEEISSNEDLVRRIFDVHFALAQQCFNQDDASDLADHNVFSSVCVELGQYSQVLEMLIGNIEGMFGKPAGRYAATVAIFYAILSDSDDWADKIESVFGWLMPGLTDESQCIREATARAIGELAERQGELAVQFADDIVAAIMASIAIERTPELVAALAQLIDAGHVPDDGFLGELIQYLDGAEGATAFQILRVVTSIVTKVPRLGKRHFEDILSLMQPIAQGGADGLKPVAIRCLARLPEVSTKLFAPFCAEFLSYLEGALDGSADDDVIYESTRAYGHLVKDFTDEVAESAPAFLERFLAIAARPLAPAEDDDEEGFVGDDADTVVGRSVRATAESIRMVCFVLSFYPQLLPDSFAKVIDAMHNQLETGQSDCAVACAKGAVFLVESLRKCGLDDTTRAFIVQLSRILAEIVQSETSQAEGAGQGFCVIADIIANCGSEGVILANNSIDSILQAVQTVFQGRMLYQGEKLRYIEDLHDPALRVVREIMAALEVKALPFVRPFIELMNELVTHPKNAMKDLALQFFGDLAYWCASAIDDELRTNVTTLAVNAVESRPSAVAFGCVKQLAEKAPQMLSAHLDQVMAAVQATLTSDRKKTEAWMIVQDNCVSALGKIAMRILGDDFPADTLLLPVLSAMPAQGDVEENNDILEFFAWLHDRAAGQCVPQFAAVLVRLFADGVDKMDQLMVSPERVGSLRAALAALLGQMEDAAAFCRETVEDDADKLDNVMTALQN